MVSTGDDMRYEIMKYENIRSLRIDNNYTQKQIAEVLGISQNTYSQYEVGAELSCGCSSEAGRLL